MARHATPPERLVVLETRTLTGSSPSILISVASTSAGLAAIESGREIAPPNSSRNELLGRRVGGRGFGRRSILSEPSFDLVPIGKSEDDVNQGQRRMSLEQ